jgi:alanine dehydrogenase
VVMKFMQHIPEDYPSIVFIEKAASGDIIKMLKDKGINAIKAEAVKENGREYAYSILRPEAVVFSTSNFDYAVDGIACTEKAFIDLFYAITREGYPMRFRS